jgi:TRAP-type C4-dicarboxylate transport system substrate-binding protein
MKKYPKDIQMAIAVAGHEAAMMNRAGRVKQELSVYDEFKKKGMTVIDPERGPFIEKSRSVYEAFKEKASPMQIKLIRVYEK